MKEAILKKFPGGLVETIEESILNFYNRKRNPKRVSPYLEIFLRR
jgi:hypothetical protein